MLNFEMDNMQDADTINRIARRAVLIANRAGVEYSLLEATMDITAAHCNGNPLRLVELENYSDANFAHDVFGIRRHIDRETGALGDCFVPR